LSSEVEYCFVEATLIVGPPNPALINDSKCFRRSGVGIVAGLSRQDDEDADGTNHKWSLGLPDPVYPRVRDAFFHSSKCVSHVSTGLHETANGPVLHGRTPAGIIVDYRESSCGYG
jgi:hypothetical protein